MMGKVVDHIVSELKEDLDKANKDRKCLSISMQVCGDYAQLAES